FGAGRGGSWPRGPGLSRQRPWRPAARSGILVTLASLPKQEGVARTLPSRRGGMPGGTSVGSGGLCPSRGLRAPAGGGGGGAAGAASRGAHFGPGLRRRRADGPAHGAGLRRGGRGRKSRHGGGGPAARRAGYGNGRPLLVLCGGV